MRTSLLAALALLAAAPAHAEVPAPELYFGGTVGGTVVVRGWDLGKNAVWHTREAQSAPQFGLRLGFQAHPQVALEAGAQFLPIPVTNSDVSAGFVFHGNVLVHLWKGDLAPFLIGGAGAYHSTGGGLGSDVDFQFNLGVGVRYMVLKWLALRAELRDVVTDGFGKLNDVDGNNVEITLGADIFPITAFGEKDRDLDGIPDARDRCPDVKGVASAHGCPDRDGDSVADAEDACPDQPGKPVHGGCPDRDGDDVPDKDDQCPDVKGLPILAGCPDRDGDGVADAEDECPDVPGPKVLKGCPDKDGDGIADKDDNCPDVAGLPALQGCPDRDGDGLGDAEDECPDEAGPKALKGCPDRDADGVPDKLDKCPDQRGLKEFDGCLPKEVEKFTGVIQGINFAWNKADILPSSFKVLDAAVAVLKKYPSMRIKIEGHTDNTGDPAYNKKLSGERAHNVMTYMLSKGIEPDRLEAEGYGQEKPIATNETEKGRAQNRRVEFNLIAQ